MLNNIKAFKTFCSVVMNSDINEKGILQTLMKNPRYEFIDKENNRFQLIKNANTIHGRIISKNMTLIELEITSTEKNSAFMPGVTDKKSLLVIFILLIVH